MINAINSNHIITPKILKKFESIWVDQNVNHKWDANKKLNDDMYILYTAWAQVNCIELHNIHIPNTIVIQGHNQHVIFHGGCLSCQVQYTHGVNTCKRCSYFKGDGNYPDLSDGNVPPETISFKKALMGKLGRTLNYIYAIFIKN